MTMKKTPGGNRKREAGWQIHPEIRDEVAELTRTFLPLSIGSALCNWLLLFAAMAATRYLRGWWMLGYPVVWLIACRALRAFENLTHEASHYNWCRKHSHLNDTLADWLCARWVGISVASYRRTHVRHHADFDSELDSIADSSTDGCSIRLRTHGTLPITSCRRFRITSWRGPTFSSREPIPNMPRIAESENTCFRSPGVNGPGSKGR